MKVCPYFYTWSQGNNAYQTPSLMSALQKYGLKIAVLAFETIENGWYTNDVPSMMDDVYKYKAAGGNVAVSFGGEASAGLPLTFAMLDDFTQKYGIKYFDFDIEGGAETRDDYSQMVAQSCVQYEQKYPDCFLSLTLPVMPDGLDNNGLRVLNIFAKNNTPLSAINIMTM